jgi:voltage-gated sodium channel
LILAVFTVDIVVKVVAEGLEPWRYFSDPWNRFDFFIVLLCFVFLDPALLQFRNLIAMVRLVRLIRVLKLVRALPQLRIIVEAISSVLGQIAFVFVIVVIFFYLYANIGMIIFAQNDPSHFGNLQLAMMSMLRIVTQDGWTDIM